MSRTTIQSARARLHAARAVRSERDGRPRPADIAYAVYIGALVAAIVGVPIIRAIVLGITTDAARAVLFAPTSATVASLVAGALLALAVLAGRTRGPAASDPFQAWALSAIDVPGRTTLRWSFNRAVALLVCVFVSVATVCGLGLWFGGGVTASAVWAFIGAAALFGMVVATGWLAGQALSTRSARLLFGGVSALVIVTALAPGALPFTPWGWVGAVWPPQLTLAPAGIVADAAPAPLDPLDALTSMFVAPVAPMLALCLAAALCATVVPRMLDRILPSTLLWQANRWQAAMTLARTGDASATFGAFGPDVVRGRGIHLALARVLPFSYLARDTVVALRRPARSLIALAALVLAGAWLGAAVSGGDGTAAALGGALLAFLAIGAFCDGLRHAADAAGRPALLGVSVRADAAMHTTLPLLVAVAACGLGALVIGGAAAALWVVSVTVCLIMVRAMDAAKGPLPIELLMPVPTPVGDASMLTVLLWQADALLFALLVAGGLTIALPAWGVGAWAGLAVSAVVLIALADHRFTRAAAPRGADRA